MAELSNVTDDSFNDQVIRSDKPVLVDFWATWCVPCKAVTPIMEEIAAEYAGKLKAAKLDVDANPRMPVQLGVMGIPALILFKAGEPVERITGKITKDKIISKITPYLI